MTAAISQVESSDLVREYALRHPCIEVWADEDFKEGGFEYFWVCSKEGEAVRSLAYVRVKHGSFEIRRYDGNGDDLWVPAR